MSENETWKKASRINIFYYYYDVKRKTYDIKRQKLMMIWFFKIKTYPDVGLSKYKARMCCHGFQQQWGVQYWETYSLVVS